MIRLVRSTQKGRKEEQAGHAGDKGNRLSCKPGIPAFTPRHYLRRFLFRTDDRFNYNGHGRF